MYISRYETSLTKQIRAGKSNPQPSLDNWKPYRTKFQKGLARLSARRMDGGHYHSSAPVSFHRSFRNTAN